MEHVLGQDHLSLLSKSKLLSSFRTNRYLLMSLEATTYDLCSIEQEQIPASSDNLTQGEHIALQELKELPECIIKPSYRGSKHSLVE